MDGDRQETALGPPRAAKRSAVDDAIEAVAGRQQHLLTSAQLCACGLSPRGVRDRVAAGRLHRIHPGVHCIHPPPFRREQRLLAAVLACGPGTSLSDLSAAFHLGIADVAPTPVHVCNAGGTGRTLRRLVVHRRAVASRDLLIVRGIPCTSAARIALDCAATLKADDLEALLLAADARRILNRRRLGELLQERRGQPGTAVLRRLITDDPVETRSLNERRMLMICRRFGVSEPLVNHRIDVGERHFYADFCWPHLRLVVEVDSWRWHGGRRAGESDADRDQLLSLAGWRVVRFTRDQVVAKAERTGRRLLALTGINRPPLEARGS